MKQTPATEIKSGISWIGIQDYNLRYFDIVMETKSGTTYNSYYIDAEKPAIIETAKAGFWNEYRIKLESVCNPDKIEYIIMNHTEPDHSGCLKDILKTAPNATVVGSPAAIMYLHEITGLEFNSIKVKDGDKLSLGNKTLNFISAPNLHWPDSIYTYLEEDQVLFTCDSFGAHYCSENISDDNISDYTEEFDYYFDVILKPYSKFMLKAIEKIRPLNIDIIAPGHGPVLCKNWKKWVTRSEKLSAEYLEITDSTSVNLLILYVSAYGYTGKMAKQVADGAMSVSGVNVECIDIEHTPSEVIESAIANAKGLIMGSPTINQNTLMPIYKTFALINPIRDKGKIAASFGSYGWSGEAPEIINSTLKLLKLKVEAEPFKDKFNPTEGKLSDFFNLGKSIAEKLSEQNTTP